MESNQPIVINYFSNEEKKFFMKHINLYKYYSETEFTPSELFNEFVKWLIEIRNVNPFIIKKENRQLTVDNLLNTERGKKGMRFVCQGFYHCWPESVKCDFLALTQELNYRPKNINWYIKLKINPLERFEVIYNLGEQEQKYYLRQINYYKQLNRIQFSSLELLDKLANWLEEIRNINLHKLRKEERQSIVDYFLNSEEGKLNIELLNSGGAYYCWFESVQCEFLALSQGINFSKETDWTIKLIFSHSINDYRYEVISKNIDN